MTEEKDEELPVMVASIDEDLMPLTVEYIAEEGGYVIMSQVIDDEGVLRVPGLAAEHGPIAVHMIAATGLEYLFTSDGRQFVKAPGEDD